jgi:hypothetical protein
MCVMDESTTGQGARRARAASWWRWPAWPVLALLAGCVTTQFEAQPVIPQPLVTRIPVVVGVHLPAAFREAVHREERDGQDVAIALGKAQTAGFERLMNTMFTRVVPLAANDASAASDPEIRGVFEPVLEEFSFVTPADTGTQMYAVSLRYRINAYKPSGEFVDSWTFTGYGAHPAASIPGQGRTALQQAAAVAMRDAGAKIAVEFREQAIVRGLIDANGAPAPAPAPAGAEVQPPP